MSASPHPFVLAGPTASGKSALAVALAEAVGGEIVNADPFQAWRGLGTITAQPDREQRERVPHHHYGTLPLDQDRDAATFAEAVRGTLDDLRARCVPAIVVSGSGLYIRSLFGGLDTGLPAPDPILRKELDACPLPVLLARLAELDPEEFSRIDRENPRRVVRAVEICLLSGGQASALRRRRAINASCVETCGIWLDMNHDQLAERVKMRTEEMFGPTLESEVRALPPWATISTTARAAIGLAEAVQWVAGTLDRASAVERVVVRTRQYARRQRTWFRKAAELEAFHVDDVKNSIRLAEGLVAVWKARRDP